jgi:hypothetical protein
LSPFPEKQVLPPPQLALWPELEAATREGFVLYGGTAVALHLGHRQSVDFDFFSERPFDPDALSRRLPFLLGAELLQAEPNTLTALVRRGPGSDDTVKVSLFGNLNFGRVGTPLRTPDGVIVAASKEDLLGHKLKVLMQRVEVKDYLDIDALLRAGVSLERGLAAAQSLFPAFAPAEGLKALAYFASKSLLKLDSALKTRLIDAARAVLSIPAPARIASEILTDDGITRGQ